MDISQLVEDGRVNLCSGYAEPGSPSGQVVIVDFSQVSGEELKALEKAFTWNTVIVAVVAMIVAKQL